MEISSEQLEQARAAGRTAAESSIEQAPEHPLLRLSWLAGWGRVEHIPSAVEAARSAGATWPEIGDALGENPHTARTKYTAAGRARIERYKARKRAESGDD